MKNTDRINIVSGDKGLSTPSENLFDVTLDGKEIKFFYHKCEKIIVSSIKCSSKMNAEDIVRRIMDDLSKGLYG